MTYHGKVKNGVVVMDPPAELPEGTEVVIEAVAKPKWMKHIGKITDEDARIMLDAIERTFERVEPEEALS